MEPRELRLAVSRLENERRRSLRKEFLQLDIPLGQGQPRLLECLLRTGPRNQRELGEECGVDPSTLSRSVDRLVEAGLVTRTQDPACRRCQKVTLTESGRRAAERVSAQHAEDERRSPRAGHAEQPGHGLCQPPRQPLRYAQLAHGGAEHEKREQRRDNDLAAGRKPAAHAAGSGLRPAQQRQQRRRGQRARQLISQGQHPRWSL